MGNNEHFDQLMLADSGLTVEQQQFKDLHERICYNARKSAEYWVEMASAIREMRDSKRYKAAGFEDFADYTVNALGIKERQAYNYISVIEKLPEEFIRAHATIGVTKIALLTSVNEKEREEILEKIDLDTAKTSEINAAVKAALAERDKSAEQLSLVLEEKRDVEKENDRLTEEYNALANAKKEDEKERKRLEIINAQLKQELERKSIPDVVFQPDLEQQEKINQAEKDIAALKEENAADKDQLRTMASERSALQKEVESLKEQLDEQKNAKVESAKVEIKDDVLVRFNVKFETLQNLLDELEEIVSGMDDPMQGNCRRAVNAVLEVKF